MAEKKIGHVTHYFGKIGVAVLQLTDGGLSVGDTIKIVGHGKEFTQSVDSLQVDHQAVQSAKIGDDIAVKIGEPVKPNDDVFAFTVD